jgi:MFS superfamily sulfate permease-like transporter
MSEPGGAVPTWGPASGRPPEKFGLALAAAIGVAVLGVVAWVVIERAFNIQTALVGLAVAVGVVSCFRKWAPLNPAAPVIVVVLTVASAITGLLATQYDLLAKAAGISLSKTVNDVPLHKVPKLLTTGTNAFTWIIIALSVYTGIRYATRMRMVALQHQARAQEAGTVPPPGL